MKTPPSHDQGSGEIGRAGGQVKMIGFDAGSQSIKDMESGDVQGLVVQDPVAWAMKGC